MKIRTGRRHWPLMMGSAMALVLSGMLAAQADDSAIETVVVTAQKRSEDIQKVPIAVTALTGADLEARGIVDVKDLSSSIPNVNIDQVTGAQAAVKFFMRGVGSDNPVFSGDPAVGVYYDDVYVARAIGAMFDLFDVDRVEVLRGPQGTLYGNNSPGGALKIVTAKPDLDRIIVKGDATVGSYNQRDGSLAVNLPIIDDKLGMRMVLTTRNHDGYQTNLATGAKAGDQGQTSGRIRLLAKPNSDLEILVGADFARARDVPGEAVNFGGYSNGQFVDLFTQPGFDKRDFYSALPSYEHMDTAGGNANVLYHMGWADLRSITGYRSLRYELLGDVDGSIRSNFEPHQRLAESEITQELNLSGSAGPLKWLVGAFYMHERNDFLWDVKVFQSLGLPQTFQVYHQDTDNFALFTGEEWAVTKRLTLSGGLRYTAETKDFKVKGYNTTVSVYEGMPQGTLASGVDPRTGLTVPFDFDRKKTWDAWQWRAAANYNVTDDAMAYVSAARGFRSGGFNGGARTVAQALADPFEPEFVTTYEGGVKTDWWSHRLRVNATYFYSDYCNIQEAYLTNGGFGTVTANATIQGLELETQLIPLEGLNIYGTLGTLSSHIDSTSNVLKYVPHYEFTLGFDYHFPFTSWGDAYFGATYYNTDKYSVTASVDPALMAQAWADVSAKIGFETNDGHWRFELSGKNLTDEYHIYNGFDLRVGPPPPLGYLSTVRYPNDPRTISFKVSFSY